MQSQELTSTIPIILFKKYDKKVLMQFQQLISTIPIILF
jgi:hypothetical protein